MTEGTECDNISKTLKNDQSEITRKTVSKYIGYLWTEPGCRLSERTGKLGGRGRYGQVRSGLSQWSQQGLGHIRRYGYKVFGDDYRHDVQSLPYRP